MRRDRDKAPSPQTGRNQQRIIYVMSTNTGGEMWRSIISRAVALPHISLTSKAFSPLT